MASEMYAVIDGTTRKISNQYAIIDSVTRQIKKMYVVVDGVTRLIYDGDSEYPYTGIVYLSYPNDSSYHYLKYSLFNPDTEYFDQTTTFQFSETSANNGKYESAAISPNAKVIARLYGGRSSYADSTTNFIPTLYVTIWDDAAQQYVNATATNTSSIRDIMCGAYAVTLHMISALYVSEDGSKIIAAAYTEANADQTKTYSKYPDLMNYNNKYESSWLLFFDVDIENKTFTFSKAVSISGYSYDLSTIYGEDPNYLYGTWMFSGKDDGLVFLSTYRNDNSDSGSYEYMYIYKINVESKTATKIYTTPSEDIGNRYTSSDGKYCKYYDYEDSTYYLLYINGSTVTTIATASSADSLPIYPHGQMFIPESNENIMYVCYQGYLYSYNINGETITYLNKVYISAANTGYYQTPGSIYSYISDICDDQAIYYGTIRGTTGSSSTIAYTRAGLADITLDSNNAITSLKVYQLLDILYNKIGPFRNARFVDKAKLEAGIDTRTYKTFTSSTTWTVPSNVSTVDIMVVGGGGGGGGSFYLFENTGTGTDDSGNTVYYYDAGSSDGSSGAGGYTKTVTGVSVTPGDVLTITVGAGGSGGVGYYNYKGTTNGVNVNNKTAGSGGGTSSVKNSSGTVLCQAYGGSGGNRTTRTTVTMGSGTTGVSGGSGSAGRGESVWGNNSSSGSFTMSPSVYGVDGTDGGNGGYSQNYLSTSTISGGSGQGTTTRAWGRKTGTLYSTAGGNKLGGTVTANTGHGGKGTYFNNETYTNQPNGSSGIVIIRYK